MKEKAKEVLAAIVIATAGIAMWLFLVSQI